MASVSYRTPTNGDIAEVAGRMRQADIAEVLASSGKTPAEALAYSLEKSSLALTAIVNGRAEAIFGVGDLNILTRTGAPWFLGTDEVPANFRTFLRHSIGWRAQLLTRYDHLINAVDDRNTVSIRWLRWLGFSVGEPIPIGKRGEMFRLFEMRRGNV